MGTQAFYGVIGPVRKPAEPLSNHGDRRQNQRFFASPTPPGGAFDGLVGAQFMRNRPKFFCKSPPAPPAPLLFRSRFLAEPTGGAIRDAFATDQGHFRGRDIFGMPHLETSATHPVTIVSEDISLSFIVRYHRAEIQGPDNAWCRPWR